jgi:branched-chain amino acid transport system ATP-binding protein
MTINSHETNPSTQRATGEDILALHDVHVSYSGGAVKALSGLNLSVRKGEVVVLLGVNGAGKTTTLRLISGLLGFNGGTQTAGTVTFEGEKIDTLDPWLRVNRGISMVMEGRRIFADLSVDENLTAGGFSTKKKEFKQNRDLAFELFPILAERHNQMAGLLSGGEQQMLAIARALMQSPRLLLLDEPSLGLAPLIVEKVKQIILEINQQGTSILLIEQNAAMGLSVADYAYVLEGRHVAHEGTGAALLADDSIRQLYLGMTGEDRRSYRVERTLREVSS